MEDIHGVDVSWLHHSNREHHHRQHAPSSPGLSRDTPPRTSAHGGLPHETSISTPTPNRKPVEEAHPVQTPSSPPPLSPQSSTAKIPIKRPAILHRTSSEKPGSTTPPDKTSLRRGSWISNLSSKFSSQNSPAQTTHAQAQGSPAAANGVNGTTSSANGALNGIQAAAGGNHGNNEPYIPQHPKGSFISNALRRLSSGSQMPMGKLVPHGGVCPRKVLNVDPNRDRCLVPELDQNKLRRVAFCVDVEIAGGPKYKDDPDTEERKKKRREKKLKERGEGEALKHPEALAAEKEQQGAVTVNECQEKESLGTGDAPNPEGTIIEDDKKETSKKKEKKKRSEAERKERKEKKRKKAEENGSIPLEITREDDDTDDSSADGTVDAPEKKPPRPQNGPTIDPLRIYRRCCQLRETPILKRISDQLSAPKSCAIATPGVVTCLDLTGSRLQLADVVTLSDWLAVVPVKKLFLEDADLNDEKVRVILAGLLAAKLPEGPRRRSLSGKNAKNDQGKTEERSGVIKKLTLNNNPKIGPEGWRHISLFIYMCKSIQALDVSMVPFPKSRPQAPRQSTQSSPSPATNTTNPPKDIADTFSKAISERLGRSKLEELVMAECSLTTPVLRKIIDGVIVSGVKRMGLAGNDIDAEGLKYVFHYLRSGVCEGLDLGGTDLQDVMETLTENLTQDNHLWGLCLADCNLTPQSLKVLLPALVTLPDLRFLDLSHNKDLLSHQTSLFLLRRHLPQMKYLKRVHLADVSLSTEYAIALAEILPECPQLAHLSILSNPAISAVAKATDEPTQEEAIALYASLAVAAKVSDTLICVDVDVPAPESGDLVKAIAKQVVAYCLKNMEGLSEIPTSQNNKEVDDLPDVLKHLIGHADSSGVDDVPPAPDQDYIMGGTGVVKALSYCLLQKATDLRRQSASGTHTPHGRAPALEEAGKAKMMSKNLLENARSIRARVQPALAREARDGNDIAYRRLMFFDQTLQGMIQRFEDEYPETRVQATDASSTHSSEPSNSLMASSIPTLSTSTADIAAPESDEDEPKALRSRHNSDVSLASRAQTFEEGQLHRFSHRIRTELMNPSRPSSSHSDQANMSGTHDNEGLPDHLMALREQFLNYSGDELKNKIQSVGYSKAFDHMVANAEQIKKLQKENPEEFQMFRQAQIAALKNTNPGIRCESDNEADDCAIED